MIFVGICCLSCSVDLDERLVPCPDNALVESVHSWASSRVLRPAAGHDWQDLLREPFREYGRPPVTMEELELRWGAPVRTWEEEGRPFAEYKPPVGILRFGLEMESSGSDSYTIWRLRWRSDTARLSQILEEPVIACIKELLQPSVEIDILCRDEGLPRVAIRLDDNGVEEMRWRFYDQKALDALTEDCE